jgi:hypothetical protein
VTLAVDLHDPDTALRTGSGWHPPESLPAERRSHFYVDLARAQLWSGDAQRALQSLATARAIAPEHIQVHPDVPPVVEELGRTPVGRSGQWTDLDAWLRQPTGVS